MWPLMLWMHHTHVTCAITRRDDPVYSTLPSLYECVLHFGLQLEHIKENVFGKEKKREKKYIFPEHHYHCHWAASWKREGRSKASAEMASGGGDWPHRRGEGQSLYELPCHPPPFSFLLLLLTFNPTWALFTLCFEADCKLHVLISLVTVAYTYFNYRCVFHPPLPALSFCSCLPFASTTSDMRLYANIWKSL